MRVKPILLTTVLGLLVGICAVQNGYGPQAAGVALVGAAVAQIAEDVRLAKGARVRKALTLTGYSLKDAAYTMGIDPSELTRALNGDRKLDAWQLERLGDEFMRTLSFLELQDRGLPAFAMTAVGVAAVMKGAK